MNRIGMYLHKDNYVELFFNEETLEFQAASSGYLTPSFATPLEALNYCRRSIERVREHDDGDSVYKPFFNSSKAPIVQTNTDKLEREMWSLDCAFAEWALTRVLYYKIYCAEYGTPRDFVVYDSQWNHLYTEQDEWEQILTDIITGLKIMVDDCASSEANDIFKMNRALRLFSKYIQFMWT